MAAVYKVAIKVVSEMLETSLSRCAEISPNRMNAPHCSEMWRECSRAGERKEEG
jgi:hypothetical protein